MDKASLANLFKNLNELEAAGNKFFDHLQAAIENPYSTQDASGDFAATISVEPPIFTVSMMLPSFSGLRSIVGALPGS